MSLFDRARDDALVILKAENSDLRAALRAEREQHEQERLRLLDRIIALAQPQAHREIHPRPRPLYPHEEKPRRTPLPGVSKSFRPPVHSKIDPSIIYGDPDVEGTPEANEEKPS